MKLEPIAEEDHESRDAARATALAALASASQAAAYDALYGALAFSKRKEAASAAFAAYTTAMAEAIATYDSATRKEPAL